MGNKSDLSDKRAVTEEEAKELAKSLGLAGYIETSAKDNINVKDIFEMLLDEIVGKPELIKEDKLKHFLPDCSEKPEESAEKPYFSEDEPEQSIELEEDRYESLSHAYSTADVSTYNYDNNSW